MMVCWVYVCIDSLVVRSRLILWWCMYDSIMVIVIRLSYVFSERVGRRRCSAMVILSANGSMVGSVWCSLWFVEVVSFWVVLICASLVGAIRIFLDMGCSLEWICWW